MTRNKLNQEKQHQQKNTRKKAHPIRKRNQDARGTPTGIINEEEPPPNKDKQQQNWVQVQGQGKKQKTTRRTSRKNTEE